MAAGVVTQRGHQPDVGTQTRGGRRLVGSLATLKRTTSSPSTVRRDGPVATSHDQVNVAVPTTPIRGLAKGPATATAGNLLV